MFKIFQALFIVIFLSSCATMGRDSRAKLLSFVKNKNYEKALKHLDSDKFFKDEDSKLLYFLEKGMVLHKMGNYAQSSVELEKARELFEKLYTVSVSKKAATVITNETMDIYYGEKYERSMLYFYLALNYYLEYLNTGKRESLFRSRATLVGWEAFQSELKEDRAGKTVFKYDLLSRLFGAFVHEEVGSSSDRQIAAGLYRDADQILLKNYNSYPSFNSKFKKFNKDYKKFASLGASKVKKSYVEATPHQIAAKEFVKKKRKGNTLFLYQEKFIPKKYAKKEYYGLGDAFAKNSAAARIGAVVLGHFAAKTLGLYPPQGYNPVGYQLGFEVGRAAVSIASISFELPHIDDFHSPQKRTLQVEDMRGKVVKKSDFYLVNPMGEIARQAVAENSAVLYTKIGARLAMKHIVAILASYGTYNAIKSKGEFFAKNAAVVQYLAVSKGIEASESADTRYWSTLPENIHLTRLNLKNGKYLVKVLDGKKVLSKKEIELSQKVKHKLISLN